MKNIFLLILLVAATFQSNAQAPNSIPYQAVVRNTDGSPMASTALTMTMSVHNLTANGDVVYQETHITTTNAQGLVSLNIGSGTPTSGSFATLDWGSGSKFLHVLMNAGNGEVDLGTQQMMSVPYALYAEEVNVRVSNTGDTLFIGNNYSIVPGVSAANPIFGCTNNQACNFDSFASVNDSSCVFTGMICDDGDSNSFNDAINDQCECSGNLLINGLYYSGSGVTDIDGNFYNSIIINGQEWMQKNLSVTKYRNGDAIPTGLNNTLWQTTTSGAYAIYGNDPNNNVVYGKLYNWFAANDSRGICPTGWHVPSDLEWTLFIDFLDPNQIADVSGIQSLTAGGKMKTSTLWNQPGGLNTSGFTALPAGGRVISGLYDSMGLAGSFWSSTPLFSGSSSAWSRYLVSHNYAVYRNSTSISGLSIRCIKD